MQRRHFIRQGSQAALLIASGISSYNCSPKNQQAEPLAKEMESLIPKLMEKHKVPGLSIALVREGRLSWTKGYGVKSQVTKEPVDEHTIFEAASISKTVFAYAVMKLCEKGTIGLDTPLVNYSPMKFLENDPRLEEITARHVLSHRTGFQNWRTPEEPLKINFDPGSGFMYSGEGYFYLQSIVTQLTGKVNPEICGNFEAGLKVCATDIGDYLERNVLAPNKMSSSGYVWTEALGKNESLPHDIDGKLLTKPHQTATDLARYAAAGGLLTTAKDYAAFIIGVFSPKENDPFFLNKNSVAEMVRPQVKLPADQKIDGASAWALGWAIQERPAGNIFLHSGGQTGFRSLAMASIEKKSAFAMFTNSDSGGHVLYNEELGNILNRLFA